jgi:chromosome segregation ATPase
MATTAQNIKSASVETASQIKKIEQVTKDLKKMFDGIDKHEEALTSLVADIDLKKSELANLSEEYSNKIRQFEIDFNLKVQEKEGEILTKLLETRKMSGVDTEEYKSLVQKLESAENSETEAVKKAVEESSKTLKDAHFIEMNKVKSEFEVKSATTEAENSSLKERIEFLNETIAELRETIKAEREARVQIEKDRAQPQFTIGNTNK